MFEESKYKELIREFTDFKKSSKALINEAEQLKYLIESSDEMISIHDFEGNYLYYYGPEKYKITPSDIIGKTPFDFFEEKVARQIVGQIKKTAETGEKSSLEINVIWQGKKTWFEEKIFPIRKNGIIVSVVKICKEINEKKKWEFKLTEQKKFFQKIVNSFTHPLYVINAETYEIEFTNDYALKEDLPNGIKCFVFSLETGKPCKDGNKFCPINLLKYDNNPVVTEHVTVDKTGEKRYFEIHGFPINDESGKLKYVIEYNIEITDKKELEINLREAKIKAEESDALKSAFLANMSHEIRTPLNGILGFADLLKREDLPDEKKKYYLDIISKSGDHLLELINDIIDISKLDAGMMKLNESNVNINILVKEIYEMLSRKYSVDKKSVNFKINNQYKGHETIISDSLRLKQILINLAGNALKFTKKGFVQIKYGLNKNNEIEFSVEDTGIGISKGDLPYVFERFRQAEHNTATELFGGTGLGLSITKSCVELLGGTVYAESEVGKGSTFTFTIPYKIV